MSRHSAMYNNAAWRRRRADQLRREPLCAYCRQFDNRVTPATIADHVTPHNGDPVKFAGPLQSLCKLCHDGRKQRQEGGRLMQGCDGDGVPLDPAHPWNTETPGGHPAPLKGVDSTPAPPIREATHSILSIRGADDAA